MKLLAIFLAGAFWDALITIDVLATLAGKPWICWATTFVLTVLSCTVYNEVFVVEGWQASRVFALASGSACGAAIAIHLNNKRKGWAE